MNRLIPYSGSRPYKRVTQQLCFGEYDPVWSIGWRLEPVQATELTEVPFIHEVVSHPQVARQLLVKEILTVASVTGQTSLYDKYFQEFDRLLEAAAAANVFVNNRDAFATATHGQDKQTLQLAHVLISIYDKHSHLISGEIEVSNLPGELRSYYQYLRTLAQRKETELFLAPSRHYYSMAIEFMLQLWLEPCMCSSQYPPSSFLEYLRTYDDGLESAVKGREVPCVLVPVIKICSNRRLANFIFVLSMADVVMEGGDLAPIAFGSLLDSFFDLQRQFMIYLITREQTGGIGLSAQLCEEVPLFGRLTQPDFMSRLKPLDSVRVAVRTGLSMRNLVQWERCYKYFVFNVVTRDMLIRRRGLRNPTVPRMRERCCSIMTEVLHRLAGFYAVWKADRAFLGVFGQFFEGLAEDSARPQIPNPDFWKRSKQHARHLLDSFDKRAFQDVLKQSLDAWLWRDTEVLSFMETAENTAKLIGTLPIEQAVELTKIYGHDLETWSPAGQYRVDKWRTIEETEDRTIWSDGKSSLRAYKSRGK